MKATNLVAFGIIISIISPPILVAASAAPTHTDLTFDTTNLSKDGRSNGTKMAVSGNYLYVAWVRDDAENSEIFFTRSADGGVTFSEPVNISNTGGLSTEPELAVSGGSVYVAWRDQTLGRDNILVARSINNGVTFSSPVNISKEIEFPQKTYMSNHQVSAYGSNVYVTWTLQVGEWGRIFFSKSTDRGANFSTPMDVSKNSEGYAGTPQITVSGEKVYITWHKGNVVPGERIYPDIYFTVSKNGGLTFSEPARLTNGDSTNSIPQIASSGNNIYLAWYHAFYREYQTPTFGILFARSTDGFSFGNVTKLAESLGRELDIPRISSSGDNVYVVWRLLDEVHNVYPVFFVRSTDGGVTFGEPINLNNITRGFPEYESRSYPAIAVSDSNVYVVWSDITSEGNYETFLTISTDEGLSFSNPVNLSNSNGMSINPVMVSSGSNVYVAWTEYTFEAFDVFFSKVSVQKTHTFEVNVEKEAYKAGECIKVTGFTPIVLEGMPVRIQVLYPNNTMYKELHISPSSTGHYSVGFEITGQELILGTYTVKAIYGLWNAETTFILEYSVEFGVGPLEVIRMESSLTNGCIVSIEGDLQSTSLVISVATNTDEDGELNMTLPRGIIDAKSNGDDDNFMVLVDGETTEFQETITTSDVRTLVIQVPAGTKQINIIGTEIIPEFPIAIIIASVAIGVMIAIMRFRQFI